MSIEWDRTLSVGLPLVDDQHRELFARVNALMEACQAGRGKEEVLRVVDFLETYVRTHFETEEREMRARQYPDYASHKNRHEVFTREFRHLREHIQIEGVGLTTVVKVNKVLVDWLVGHIGRIDRAFGAFCNGGK